MFKTTDKKISFNREEDGSITVVILATDGSKVLTRTIPADEWLFLVKVI